MVFHMKTTLNIDETVMKRLKAEAARRGTTMSELVEAGLRRVLEESEDKSSRRKLPKLPSWSGGAELVDVADREQLYSAMDAD